MKLSDWIIVVSLILVSNLITLYVAKKYIYQPVEIKVIDIKGLLDENRMLVKKALIEGKITKEQAEKFRKDFIDALEKRLSEESGIVIVKQAIVGGEVNDITGKIKEDITK